MDAQERKGYIAVGLFLGIPLAIFLGFLIDGYMDAPRKPTEPQAQPKRYRVITKSGTVHSGILVSDGWTELVLESYGQRITIKKSEIESTQVSP